MCKISFHLVNMSCGPTNKPCAWFNQRLGDKAEQVQSSRILSIKYFKKVEPNTAKVIYASHKKNP